MRTEVGQAYYDAKSLSEINSSLVRWSVAWQRVESCPACGAPAPRHFATLCNASFARCGTCGLVFADPRPPEAVLETFYNGPYYANWRALEREPIGLFTKRALLMLLEDHGFKPEQVDTDTNTSLVLPLVMAWLFKLDFISPAHADDIQDVVYVPTRLGRRLGLRTTRSPLSSRLAGALRLLSWIDRLVLSRIPGLPRTTHLYAIARKNQPSAGTYEHFVNRLSSS